MSGAVTGGAVAAIAAAKKKAEEREEEEKLTQYQSNDMDNWEFKIMRSGLGRFGNPEYLKKTRDEESVSGWEMVEKFDNHRVRFKRKIENRSKDQFAQIDPYRTSAGFSGGSGAIKAAIIGLLTLGLMTAILFAGGGFDFDRFGSSVPIISIGVLAALIGVIVALKKR